MNIQEQEKARENRKEKYRIARELNIDVETAVKIRNWNTTHFIVFCYNKIRPDNIKFEIINKEIIEVKNEENNKN